MEKLIDISQHNGQINFEKVKNDGIDGVIIRVGWIGNKQNHTLDTRFEEYYKQAKQVGLKIGFYVYSYCKSVETLRQGIVWLLDKINNKECEIGVFLDLEDNTIEGIGKEELTKQAKQFCEIVQNTGYISGVYANKYWFNNLIDVNQISNYKIWLAEWNGKEEHTANFKVDIWQYTSKGNVNGINENTVDLNKIYYSVFVIKKEKSIDELAKEVIEGKYGNGEERKINLGSLYQEVQNKVNEILKPKNNDIIYIVKKGDCLCNIAKKFHTTVNKIATDNGITNVDFIHAGQKLIIRK